MVGISEDGNGSHPCDLVVHNIVEGWQMQLNWVHYFKTVPEHFAEYCILNLMILRG